MKRISLFVAVVCAATSFSISFARSDDPSGSEPGMAPGRDISDMSDQRQESAASYRWGRDERVREGHRKLDEESSRSPAIVLEGLASFNSPLHLRDAVELARTRSLEIRQFFHTEVVDGQRFVGGYPGSDDPDAQATRYEQDQELMLQDLIVDTTATIARTDDPERRKGLGEMVGVFQQRLTNLKTGGIQIYGVRLKGAASDLQELSRSPEVLVIEPTGEGDRRLPLLPGA